ncbi:MAG: hypothetical protein HY658_11070 [Actinobacteria bacterium]|nr:hypothetical protein [Actinomycetota bacterium]
MEDPWATVEALAGDRTSGAAGIAERAALALPAIPKDELPDAIEALLRGHPAMAPLWRLATAMLAGRDREARAERFLETLRDGAEAARALAGRLPDSVVTISYSSTVIEALRLRRPGLVVCLASGGEGRRMAGEVRAHAPTIVVDDDRALARLPGEAVVVGADAITPTVVVNKVRTRELVEAAEAAGLPRFAVAGSAKLVAEELPGEDRLEATALHRFTGIALPQGVVTPKEAGELASRAALHPALRLLIPRL